MTNKEKTIAEIESIIRTSDLDSLLYLWNGHLDPHDVDECPQLIFSLNEFYSVMKDCGYSVSEVLYKVSNAGFKENDEYFMITPNENLLFLDRLEAEQSVNIHALAEAMYEDGDGCGDSAIQRILDALPEEGE